MKRKKTSFIFLLIIAAVCVFLCATILTSSEPYYDGRTLTAWLTLAWREDGPKQLEAENAIRKIGTNALPLLLKMAMAHDSAFKAGLLDKVPYKVRLWLGWRNEDEKYYLACAGFHALGPNAKPICPVLIKLLDDKNPDNRICAVQALSAIGPAAEDAVPALIQHFNDKDISMQDCVRSALGSIHARPEVVVPLLLQSLEPSNRVQANHISSMIALTNFQDLASEIIPAVIRLESDPDPATRGYATNLLKAFNLGIGAK